ncbi:hypothetical protein SAMN05216464_13022 [Mucilaginibacter pineti]|uniref:Uncharacterized protein n=1 Tax=Mucilaginibacter pineti TaxID=1391627 RepID=A0A1G7NVW9_9SPHI|nr:hypothetical protein SAMN05216464_13022 [Mucilaginibacter pineti]
MQTQQSLSFRNNQIKDVCNQNEKGDADDN